MTLECYTDSCPLHSATLLASLPFWFCPCGQMSHLQRQIYPLSRCHQTKFTLWQVAHCHYSLTPLSSYWLLLHSLQWSDVKQTKQRKYSAFRSASGIHFYKWSIRKCAPKGNAHLESWRIKCTDAAWWRDWKQSPTDRPASSSLSQTCWWRVQCHCMELTCSHSRARCYDIFTFILSSGSVWSTVWFFPIWTGLSFLAPFLGNPTRKLSCTSWSASSTRLSYLSYSVQPSAAYLRPCSTWFHARAAATF